jgi:hypothetical protein
LPVLSIGPYYFSDVVRQKVIRLKDNLNIRIMKPIVTEISAIFTIPVWNTTKLKFKKSVTDPYIILSKILPSPPPIIRLIPKVSNFERLLLLNI